MELEYKFLKCVSISNLLYCRNSKVGQLQLIFSEFMDINILKSFKFNLFTLLKNKRFKNCFFSLVYPRNKNGM